MVTVVVDLLFIAGKSNRSGSGVCRYHSGHHCFRQSGSSSLCHHTSYILWTLPDYLRYVHTGIHAYAAL